LSSIPYVDPLKSAFEGGLGASVDPNNIEQKLGYDTNAIKDALGQLEAIGSVQLIVTLGGLITAETAAQWGTKSFGSIVGDSNTIKDAQNFKYALDLRSYKLNMQRIQKLSAHLPPGAKIGLLSNDKSRMRVTEQRSWPNNNISPINISESDTTDADQQQKYKDGFGNFAASVQCVVISADPYFLKTAKNLVAIAKSWKDAVAHRRVCFPLVDYKQYATPPRAGFSFHGANLQDEYKRLGKKAKYYLDNPTDPASIDNAFFQQEDNN